jgi:glucose uptake protein
MIAGMIFWGSWPTTYRLTTNWRIELLYWDFILGIFSSAILLAMTMGTYFGPFKFTTAVTESDPFLWLYAIAAGALWNCGNLLLILGVSLVGLSVAFPVSIGLALVIGVIGSYLVMPRGNPVLLFSGVALVFLAILLNSVAYWVSTRKAKTVSIKGLTICFISGIVFSVFGPLIGKALSSAGSSGPYGVTCLFTLGALISTPILMWCFMKHPTDGPALRWKDYSEGSWRNHAAGFLGGLIWAMGTTFTFVSASAVGIALAYAIGQTNPLIAALWGTFVWREFKGAPNLAYGFLAVMFACYLGGLFCLASSY